MHLVQILLPLADNDGRPFAPGLLAGIRQELVERFGGLTAYARAPAQGVWDHDGQKSRDDIMVVEVMLASLDQSWWLAFRHRLEKLLEQDVIVIRSYPVTLL